jgi:glutathione S-transferase
MIHFYYASGSPWAWRVHLALEEKGLPYEGSLLSFSAGDLHKPEFLAMNPHGKVPALTDDGLALYESQAMLEYLEERYPAAPLLPVDPAARALVRIEELECTTYMSEAFRGLAQVAFFTPEGDRDPKTLADRRADVRSELAKLELRVAARGGDFGNFLMGEQLTRADTTWLPFVEIVGRAGVPIEADSMLRLAAWLDRMRARPSYEKTYPPHWRQK